MNNKAHTVVINGKVHEMTNEELEYTKKVYGGWSEVYYFNKAEFYSVPEMAELLPIKKNTIYVKNKRNPEKFPLDEFNGKKGSFVDNFFLYWLKNE